MDPAACQFPDQPCLHGSKEKLASGRPLLGAPDMVQDPPQLGRRKICVDQKPCLLPPPVRQSRFVLQPVAKLSCAPTLPDDGVIYRKSGLSVPDDGGLPLVGDADGIDGRCSAWNHCQRLPRHLQLGLPYLHGVVLHPSCLRIDLPEFFLGDTDLLPHPVIDDAAGTGGSLIQRHDVSSLHRCVLFCL